jgi:undecaprenyl-diphosphatase
VSDSKPASADAEAPGGNREPGGRRIHEIDALDEEVMRAVSSVPTPMLDGPITRISKAANYGRLWFAIAALIALVGGHRGRGVALRGVAAWGVTALVADLALKDLVPRRRPTPTSTIAREVRMPVSSSFPSGHTASGFAFAAAVTADVPVLAIPLYGLASIVGYSRIHGGVHYPSDVIAGSVLGLAVGTTVRYAALRIGPRRLRPGG